jgi:hypothetical protein
VNRYAKDYTCAKRANEEDGHRPTNGRNSPKSQAELSNSGSCPFHQAPSFRQAVGRNLFEWDVRRGCSTKQQRRVTDTSLQDKNLSYSNRHSQMLEQYRQTILNAFREVADLLVALQTRGEQLASQHQEV